MSEPSAFGFGQFVPGFDFLQNLSKPASQAQPAAAAGMPGMGSWVAPTLSIEDIDKRIQELKSVLFWLEQNTTALKATIQAMEVQKMTLTTLQSMNVNMADLAKAFTVKPPVPESAAAEPATPTSDRPMEAAKTSFFTPKPAPQVVVPEAEAAPEVAPEQKSETPPASSAPADAAAPSASDAPKSAVDPMQWWGALTQQFQGIAAAALKDVAGEALKAGMTAQNAKAPMARKSTASKSASPAKPRAKTQPKPQGKGASVAAASAVAPQRGSAKAGPPVPSASVAVAPAKTTRKVAKSAAAAPRKTAKK